MTEEKLKITKRHSAGWTEYAKSIPVDIEVYRELEKIKAKTNRTFREIVSELIRFALKHTEY